MIWKEDEVCNRISNAVHENFREENYGYDSDVFVDEVVEDGVIALNWHHWLDWAITYDYVSRVANFIFKKFPEVNVIMSPCGDFQKN